MQLFLLFFLVGFLTASISQANDFLEAVINDMVEKQKIYLSKEKDLQDLIKEKKAATKKEKKALNKKIDEISKFLNPEIEINIKFSKEEALKINTLKIIAAFEKVGMKPKECSVYSCMFIFDQKNTIDTVAKLRSLNWELLDFKRGQNVVSMAPKAYYASPKEYIYTFNNVEYETIGECLKSNNNIPEDTPLKGCYIYDPKNGESNQKVIILDGKIIDVRVSYSDIRAFQSEHKGCKIIERLLPFRGCDKVLKSPLKTDSTKETTNK